MEQKHKNLLEMILDVLAVLVVADIVWVFFFKQEPPVDFFHNFIAIIGTIAAGWVTWKAVRKDKALG
jgi:hypothetical protein